MQNLIRYFKVSDGTEIEYADLGGNGPVLLLIPGYSLATDLILPFLSRFSDRFRCVTLTLRGFGGTTPATRGSEAKGEITLAQAARDVKELMAHLGLQDVIVMGYSMGTHVAFSYIRQFGCENIARLVILDMTPKLINDDTWQYGLYQGHYTEARCQADLAAMQTDYQKDFNNYFFYQACVQHTREDVRDYVFTPEIQSAVDAYAATYGVPGLTGSALTYLAPERWSLYRTYWAEMCRQDYRDMLRDITVPTGILHAMPGSIYDIRTAEYLEENIPDAKRYPIENAVHVSVTRANAGDTIRQFNAFLADHPLASADR